MSALLEPEVSAGLEVSEALAGLLAWQAMAGPWEGASSALEGPGPRYPPAQRVRTASLA